jgi:hypothetical protein
LALKVVARPRLSLPLHRLALDGVYKRGIDEAPEFVEVPESTEEALQTVLHKIITRLICSCRRWSSCSGWMRWCPTRNCI